MADERLKTWEILFERALVLIDDARASGIPVDDWTFGGGTVLMRRHRHLETLLHEFRTQAAAPHSPS